MGGWLLGDGKTELVKNKIETIYKNRKTTKIYMYLFVYISIVYIYSMIIYVLTVYLYHLWYMFEIYGWLDEAFHQSTSVVVLDITIPTLAGHQQHITETLG